MRLVERLELGIDDAQGDGAEEANETDGAGGYLEHPVEFERAEPPQKDHSEGEQEEEGAGESDGVDDDQSGEGT